MGFEFPLKDIGDAVASAGEAAGNMAADAGKAVAEGAGAAAGAIGDAAGAAGNMAADAGKAVADGAGAAAGAIGDAAGAAADAVGGAANAAFDAAGNAAGAVVGAAGTAANTVGGAASGAGKVFADGAGGVADSVGHGVDQAGHAVADAIVAAGSAAGGVAGKLAQGALGLAKEARVSFTDMQAMTILSACYEKAIDGISGFSKPVQDLAHDYLSRYHSVERASKELIRAQLAKSASSGFITSLGGIVTLPTAVPADIASVMYIQIRMAAALAAMGGHDVTSEQVRTLVFASLVGNDAEDLFSDAGVHMGNRVAMSAVQKVPAKVLIGINSKVGLRLAASFGSRGALAVGRMIPIIGGVIAGGINVGSTRAVGNAAYRLFIKG